MLHTQSVIRFTNQIFDCDIRKRKSLQYRFAICTFHAILFFLKLRILKIDYWQGNPIIFSYLIIFVNSSPAEPAYQVTRRGNSYFMIILYKSIMEHTYQATLHVYLTYQEQNLKLNLNIQLVKTNQLLSKLIRQQSTFI